VKPDATSTSLFSPHCTLCGISLFGVFYDIRLCYRWKSLLMSHS
jgi:hypothetical protein